MTIYSLFCSTSICEIHFCDDDIIHKGSAVSAHAVAFAATTKTREHFAESSYTSADNAQNKNCPSSGIDDRPGRDLFRMLKRSPISQPHTLGLRRGYSDGKAVGNTTGLRRRLHPHWGISLLQSLCRALGQTEASSNFQGLGTTRARFEPHEQRPTRHEANALNTTPHVRSRHITS